MASLASYAQGLEPSRRLCRLCTTCVAVAIGLPLTLSLMEPIGALLSTSRRESRSDSRKKLGTEMTQRNIGREICASSAGDSLCPFCGQASRP
eukprot:6304521-Amphidinium_carterae.1